MTPDDINPHELAQELTMLKLEHGWIEARVGHYDAYALIACLQLAWRHPHLSVGQKEIIEGFARQLERAFDREDTPMLKASLEMGWHVELDIPVADQGKNPIHLPY